MPANATGSVAPTLFIGLGGTGKEVLLRLRRRFYERFGETGLPTVGYLWLDTDSRDHVVKGEQLGEIDERVKFGPDEKLSLLSGKVGDGNLGVMISDTGRYDYIHTWLPYQVEIYGREIKDGAGAVRSIGRLTFFDKKPDIERQIKERLKTINDDPAHEKFTQRFPGLDFDPPRVCLVFSVAGGTGGGIFLDTAFLLRKIGVDRVIGYAVLPNAFATDPNVNEKAARYYANAYSALKELEHYSRRIREPKGTDNEQAISIDYQVNWTGTKQEEVQGPPFSELYLCEMVNELGVSAGEPGELFRGISESLFRDVLPGPLATAKRSKLSNDAQPMASVQDDQVKVADIKMRQGFSRRYVSFGISKIEIPVESIREACACHLAYEILGYITRQPRLSNLMGVAKDDIKGTFDMPGLTTLYGLEWKTTIDDGLAEKCPETWPSAVEASQANLAKFVDDLRELFKEFERTHLRKEGVDFKKWGEVTSAIRNATKPLQPVLEDKLRLWVAQTIDRPELGLEALRGETGLLVIMIDHFRKIYRPPSPTESEREQAAADRDAEQYKAARDTALDQMEEVIASHGVRLLGVRKWTLKALYARVRDNAVQYARARAAALLAEEEATLAKTADDYLLRVKLELENGSQTIETLRNDFKRLRDSFLDFTTTYKSVRLYEASDFDKFYVLGFDERTGRHEPVSPSAEYERFLGQTLGAGKGTLDLFEELSASGGHHLTVQLRAECAKRFQNDFHACQSDREKHRRCGRLLDVFAHPALKENAKDKYQTFVNGAFPMLKRGVQFPGAQKVIKTAFLGTPSQTGDGFVRLRDGVEKLLSANDYTLTRSDILDSGDPSTIYLYTEARAFSLPTVNTIVEECHTAYYEFYQPGSIARRDETSAIPLHLSQRWEGVFDDLRLVEGKEAKKRLEALEILTLGPVLGVVGLRDDAREGLGFVYKEFHGMFSDDVTLGRNKREAVETLVGNDKLRDTLRASLASREAQLAAGSDAADTHPRRETYAWALTFLNFKCFPETTTEHRIVIGKLTEIGRTLQGQDDLSALNTEARIALCRERLEDKASWVGEDFPALKGMSPFVYGKDEPAVRT